MDDELIHELVGLVQDNISIFRKKWDEFCQLVDNCAAEFQQHYFQYTGDLNKRYQTAEKAMEARNVAADEMNKNPTDPVLTKNFDKLRQTSDAIWTRCKTIQGDVLKRNTKMKQEGWSLWHDIDGYYLNLKAESTIPIAVPPKTATPALWCFHKHKYCYNNLRGPKDSNESLLVEYARVSAIHDSLEWDLLTSTDQTVIWNAPNSRSLRKKCKYFVVHKGANPHAFIWALSANLKEHEHVIRRALKRIKQNLQNKKTGKRAKSSKPASGNRFKPWTNPPRDTCFILFCDDTITKLLFCHERRHKNLCIDNKAHVIPLLEALSTSLSNKQIQKHLGTKTKASKIVSRTNSILNRQIQKSNEFHTVPKDRAFIGKHDGGNYISHLDVHVIASRIDLQLRLEELGIDQEKSAS
jgi:hypothetical protein